MVSDSEICGGKWEILKKGKNKIVLCVGNRAIDAAMGIDDKDAEIVNARFIKPLDIEYLNSVNKAGNIILTIEDNSIKGGFGESVLAYLNSAGKKADVMLLGHKDEYIENLDTNDVLKKCGFSKNNIEKLLNKNS